MRFILAYLLMLSIFALNIFANQFFVATDGNDNTGTGTIGAPYATVMKAISLAAAHDTVTLREGVYLGTGDDNGITEPYITLLGYPGETVRIREPWNTTGSSAAVYFYSTAHHGTVRNLHITGGNYYAIKFESEWGWGDNFAHHGLIEDCEIDSSANDCIKITPGCDGVIIRRCEIHHSGMSVGGYPNTANADGVDNVNSDSVLLQDCYLHHISGHGIYNKGGAIDCIVERCKFRFAATGPVFGFQTDLEWMSEDVNPELYQNINGIIRNCIIMDCTDEGLGWYCAKDARAYNNTLIRCGVGANSYGVAVRFGLQGTWTDVNVSPSSLNPWLVNNVVLRSPWASQDGETIYLRGSEDSASNTAIAVNTLFADCNIYWDPKLTSTHVEFANRNNGTAPVYYTTLTEWQNASNLHNPVARDQHTLVVDPDIDTITAVPNTGSPCLANGMAVPGLVDDFFGNPRGSSNIDIGAIQISATGIEKSQNTPVVENLNVFPQPAKGAITIRMHLTERSSLVLAIYNIHGQVVTEEKAIHSIGVFQTSFNIGKQPAGLYFLRVRAGTENYCKKLIVCK